MVDGWHRVTAARAIGKTLIEAYQVYMEKPGSLDEMRWLAVKENLTPGLKLTNKEKLGALQHYIRALQHRHPGPRGGALRDLRRHDEAKRSGIEAHGLTPPDYRPCTLLGAVHMEMGDYTTGADWYEKAEARGATQDSIDRELQSILDAASKDQRARMEAVLKARDTHRYNWL